MECAAIGVPDKRLGELVAAVVVPKEAYKGGKVTEQELIEFVKPRYGFIFNVHDPPSLHGYHES